MKSLSNGLIEKCEGIILNINLGKFYLKIWLIFQNEKNKCEIKDKKREDDKKEDKSKGEHIMISYNWKSQEMCKKIKKELEGLNHKVWMDVDEIHGSSLESKLLNFKIVNIFILN